MKRLVTFFSCLFLIGSLQAAYILLPMDPEGQKNHLKAYGITYWVLDSGAEAYWLLNYKGGSFAFEHLSLIHISEPTRQA